MRSCPFCNEENKDNNYFCIKCGNKLSKKEGSPSSPPKRKISGFKIFIILILSIVVLSIIVLSVLYIFTDFLRVREATISEESQDQYLQKGEEIELSEDQKRLLSMFGYPDEFMIVFDQDNKNLRIETWLYEDMESSYTFLSGKYNSSDRVITDELLSDDFDINPEDFVYGMSPDEVNHLLGDEGIVEIDSDTNLKTITYGEGLIVCKFTANAALVSVLRARGIRSD